MKFYRDLLKNRARSICFILPILTLLSCRQQQVWLSQYQRANEADQENIIRVYMDRFGDFYPKSSVYIDYRDFSTGKGINNARLEDVFVRSRENTFNLAKAYQLSGRDSVTIYRKAQESILKDYRKQFDAMAEKSIKKVVVLVHGFNDPNPAGDYQELRSLIKSKENNDLIFIEIYWDGLTANGASPGTSGIWGKAQGNSRY